MTAVSDKWLAQRQPSTGPRGAPAGPVGPIGVEAEFTTQGATGTAPIDEEIDMSAVFPTATYGDWTGYATILTQGETPLEAQVEQVFPSGDWQLRVWTHATATAPVPAGAEIRVRLFPPGTVLP